MAAYDSSEIVKNRASGISDRQILSFGKESSVRSVSLAFLGADWNEG
jgi:hypothetical protein